MCALCNLYVSPTKIATSYNTNNTYKIKGTITCDSEYIIYQIKDSICKIDYVGYSTEIKRRWSNHKSHIKKYIKSCELSTHINFGAPDKHPLNRSTQAMYDKDLSSQLSVIFLEEVTIDPSWNYEQILEKMEAREYHWQCQLKVINSLGGICKRTTNRAKK